MFLLLPVWTQEAGLPTKAEIPGICDTVVPNFDGTCTDTVCSFSPRYGSEEPVSVAECHASTFGSIDRLEGTGLGRGQGQGTQTGTSGTQGCVYAVIPQAKRADQPDKQGTFLLFHLLTRILFKFGCIIFIIIASCVIDLSLKVETFGKVVVWEFSPRK